jgi:hypothetical protein
VIYAPAGAKNDRLCLRIRMVYKKKVAAPRLDFELPNKQPHRIAVWMSKFSTL